MGRMNVEYISTSDLSYDELIQRVGKPSKNAPILLASAYRDRLGIRIAGEPLPLSRLHAVTATGATSETVFLLLPRPY
jgi:hypothetical protein